MTKIYFNMEKLQNDFLPCLISLQDALNKTKDAANSMEVLPFSQSGYLNALPGLINDVFLETDKVKTWIESSIRSYHAYSEDTIRAVNSIEDLEIKPRSSIVVSK